MGKIFWIACVLGLAVAAGLWAYGALYIGEDVAALSKAVNAKRKDLNWLAERKDEIRNQFFIDWARARADALQAEKGKLEELMRSREVNPAKVFEKTPPPEELAQFRQWLTAMYGKRDEQLRAAGVRFPAEPSARGDVFQWDTVRNSDYPRILREFIVSTEVSKALAEASGDVTYRLRGKDGKEAGAAEERRKVDELKRIAFLADPAPQPGTRTASPTTPATEIRVAVTFVSHYNVALDVIRRLEKSEQCLFVIRKTVLRRLDVDPREYPDALRKVYTDAQDHETPVEVDLVLGLLSFPSLKGTAEKS